MKEKRKRIRVLAILGVVAIVSSLIALLVFTQSVGAKKSEMKEEKPTSLSKSRYTYLVLGKDRASGLTDVMMLVSVDTAEKSAAIVQIPRDTYARYTENGYRKLNGAITALGADGVCDFVEENMGVLLDGYFVFDLDTFAKAVKEYIHYYNNERIQKKTKWMPPIKYREASMSA
jgi:anionic cell wall polymer biosynthesis LytR-Cps2A-Psr (LCP) family protein